MKEQQRIAIKEILNKFQNWNCIGLIILTILVKKCNIFTEEKTSEIKL